MIRAFTTRSLRFGIRVLSRLEKRLRLPQPLNGLPSTGWVEIERMGLKWRLNMENYIDREVALHGVFESDTTKALLHFLRPGMRALDVGANIGYYTMLMARAVGPSGKVWAFEPTSRYRQRLEAHLQANNLASRVRILPYGLSDQTRELSIGVGRDSATLHWTGNEPAPDRETITLHSLDERMKDLDMDRVDIIKLDTDGHEPSVIRGARELLRFQRPIIALEFAQHCLHAAGSDVREQARLIRELGYVLYSEKTLQPYASEMDFLMECGNFAYSGNALAIPENPKP